jgi:Fe-S-cluster containining protein
MNQGPDDILAQLYRDVDGAASRLQEAHRDRLHCRPGCSPCCVDGITVFAVEAENILRRHRELLGSGMPHASGACAFLDNAGRCRIYDERPYVCRTQGLPLRWMDEDAKESVVEMRDICPLNENGTPVEELPPGDCWTIGPFEARLAELQHRHSGAAMTRVRLRTLFRKGEE